MPQSTAVHVVLYYSGGEYSRVTVHATEEKALAAAAKYVYAVLNDAFVELVLDEGDDADELYEWVDNMKSLFEHENYKTFVECWDEWVAEGRYIEPAPRNFDIERHEVDG